MAKEKYPPCPADFVPNKEKALKAGMSEHTYEVEAEAFKDHYCGRVNAGKIFDWNRTWSLWVAAWISGRYRPSPKYQHQPPLSHSEGGENGFRLTLETKMQLEAWAAYAEATNSRYFITQIKRVREGFDKHFYVQSEYPPNYGNVIPLKQAAMAV